MKKTKILALATLSFAACLAAGAGVRFAAPEKAIAEELAPTVEIVGHTLSLENDVHIKYAVDAQNLAEGDSLKLQINETETLTSTETTTNGESTYYVFEYTGFAAKNMTDWVYAEAIVERGETVYKSAKDKYSILEYAYNKLGKTEAEETTEENLKPLLNSLLSYGAAAQVYFDYKTDNLATDNFSYVRIDNATFEDGFNYGILKSGEQVRVYANEGYELSSTPATYLTENESGEIYLTVPAEKTIDTTSFVEIKKYSEGLEYTLLSNDTYEVSGIGTCTDADIIIPETYNGKAVTSIGNKAFYNCTSLTSVVIGGSLASIGGYSFAFCCNLKTVEIGESIVSIGECAFANAFALESVNYNGSIENWCNIPFGFCANPLAYAEEFYINNELVVDVVIPNGISKIYQHAFDCNSLTSVVIPDSVNVIESCAFGDCVNLQTVSFEGILEDWCNIEFSDKTANPLYHGGNLYIWGVLLTDLRLPSTVKEIKANSFTGCGSLTSVVIPDSVTSIGSDAFYGCESLVDLVIGGGIRYIESEAFANLISLQKLYYNGTVEGWCNIDFGDYFSNPMLYDEYFYLNNELVSELEIPEGITQIKNYTFNFFGQLKKIRLPNSLTSIGDWSFNECINLESIEIPDSVTAIGEYAFDGCDSLTTLRIPESLNELGYRAFYNCLCMEYNEYENGCYLGNEENEYVLLVKVKNKDATTFIAHKDTKFIQSYAFKDCDNLTSITLSNSIISITGSLFVGEAKSLTSVYITDIAAWCNIDFTLGDANPLCYAKNLYLNNELVTELIIPDTVTKIKNYAFYNCTSLTSVVIPDSVTSIGDEAFRGCTSLTSVTFKNTEGWWRASSSTATSGTSISSTDLADPAKAATYLKSTYYNYYWKRS